MSQFKSQGWLPPLGWRLLLIALLVLGVYFRFVNIDRKVYWRDEAYTSMRISGYTIADVTQEIFTGQIVSQQQVQNFQRLSPDRGLDDTMRALSGNPEHPPLYYLSARFWAQVFGTSVQAMRSWPAILSLLAFPAAFWLCWELFPAPMVGWIAIALIAVSPLHVLYAQEARQYSLWIVTILLSHAALLRAMRTNAIASWAIYALTLASAFYTFLFTALVAIAQGLYVLLMERFRWTTTLRNFLLAGIASVIAFLPWIVLILTNFARVQQVTAHTGAQEDLASKITFSVLVQRWGTNISRLFLDGDFRGIDLNHPVLIVATVAIAIAAFYWLVRHTETRVWLLVYCWAGVNALALILPDLLVGGRRSVVPRYSIPAYLAIEVAVAFLLASWISGKVRPRGLKVVGQVLLISLLLGGLLSCRAMSQSGGWWWNKASNANNPAIARIINQAERPLVIADADPYTQQSFDIGGAVGDVLSLSYSLDDRVEYLLTIEPNVPEIPPGYDVFLLDPAEPMRAQLEQQYQIETVYERSGRKFLSRVGDRLAP
ncbi:glycosyltransferase family 39 protein [Desertifilum sp. FACHB-1129]|uniref:Glycosyltransferase RgtA/B/C/D-like domain-containing protein n=1 Tax=Desertifilum tharense IPPAS B-1220 TaxID=1781255 RepID=A0A1E5QLN9_9CYAN|nr:MULTISPECIES: glycosyltransferase family 39 protein [Desertifilum]MDA0209321.1 glycosyltransferase family 39 protein [Cyanobacteria bacterium FC1]MBD2315004.1 glycosyltransferase family 39 protein [Desertifilum sp. FACHB-1129]MBD2322881.1 glycosyltransferase family 39 protein [Desertifilum sp. FACHB-866]MBD2332725.1 glycosyltransferase family 39 protein [Desertifilum sp. FACHB-868]OEJ75612.1 hypothetical protein BH720_08860 [Desertifilum tharense IPPAS B-1220]